MTCHFKRYDPSLIISFSHFFKITLFPFDLYEIFRHVTVLSRFTLPEKLKYLIFFVSVLQVLLFISWSVELNPGPVSPQKKLSFAVWNLDSFPARDFARIPLIESLQNINDFDMFGVCESMLTSNILNEDNGFSPEPLRSDKGLNTRNGGVCIYFKESLPIKERKDHTRNYRCGNLTNQEKNLCCSFVLSSKYFNWRTQRIFEFTGKTS